MPPTPTSNVTRIGSSSGIVAYASASPDSSICRNGLPSSTPSSGTSTLTAIARTSVARASSDIVRCSGVGGSLASLASLPRRPSSLSPPTAVTTADPFPATIDVPSNSIDERSASTVSSGTGAAPLAAPTGSPVSADSSAASPADSSTRASPATTSPASTTSTSPATTCPAGTATTAVSRRTRALGAVIVRSASSAL
jgi:hypothetical protein